MTIKGILFTLAVGLYIQEDLRMAIYRILRIRKWLLLEQEQLQLVRPHLGASAKKHMSSKEPSSIDVRNNQPTDPNWISTQPELAYERRKNFETLLTGGMVKEDLVSMGGQAFGALWPI